MIVKEQLQKQAQNYPRKEAVFFQDSSISFLELKENSFKTANCLISLGLGKGDKAAVLLPNNLEAVYSQLGIFSMGAVLVPLDFMLAEPEVIGFINHSGCKILITQPKKGLDLSAIKDKCPALEHIITCRQKVDGCLFWDECIDKSLPDMPSSNVGGSDVSSIFYTSGSTGRPKGVVLTYGHFDNPPATIDYFLKVTADDVFLCGGVPFSHVGGLVYILMMVSFASKLVLMERFHPFEFIKNLERHKVTIFCIVPAMYVAILMLKEYENFDLSSLRFAVVFGAPSSPQLLSRFLKAYPYACRLNGWGMTETAAPNTISPPDAGKLNSIGRFTPAMQVKIVNDQGNSLDTGRQGELWVKGPAVMKGYYKNPELTRQVLTSDGWLKTGDIARLDEEGLCYIVGRKKDMIKVAGEIVFSSEVEAIICRHPKVQEAAVIGMLDNLRGQVPKAFVAVRESQVLNESELKEFLKEKLAHFKIPRRFEFIPSLPKNRVGKIDKTKLVRSQ